MRTSLFLIKADVGSIGGHVAPSERLVKTVREYVSEARDEKLMSDFYVLMTGDDVGILMVYEHGASRSDAIDLQHIVDRKWPQLEFPFDRSCADQHQPTLPAAPCVRVS